MAKCPTASSSLPYLARPTSDDREELDPRQTKSDTDINDKNISPEVHQLRYQRLLRRIPSVMINQWPHVSWRDVKEIVFPKCSAPDCEIVLSSMKVLFKYPYEKSMIKCDRKSQQLFAMKGHIVPMQSFLLNLNILEDSILNLHYAVKTKHRHLKPGSSVQGHCKYTLDHINDPGNKTPVKNKDDLSKDNKGSIAKIGEVVHKGIKYPALVRSTTGKSARTEMFVLASDLLSKSNRISPIIQKACLLYVENDVSNVKNQMAVLSNPSPLEASELIKKKQRLGQLNRKDQTWRFITSQSILINRIHLLMIHNGVNTKGLTLNSDAMKDCLSKWFSKPETKRLTDSKHSIDGNNGQQMQTPIAKDVRSKWYSKDGISLTTNIEQGIQGVVLSVKGKGKVNDNTTEGATCKTLKSILHPHEATNQNKSIFPKKKNMVVEGKTEYSPTHSRFGTIDIERYVPVPKRDEQSGSKARFNTTPPLNSGQIILAKECNNVMLKQRNGQIDETTSRGDYNRIEGSETKVFIGSRYDTNKNGKVETVPYSKDYTGPTKIKNSQKMMMNPKVKPPKRKIWRHDVRKVLRSLELENICKSFENEIGSIPSVNEKTPHFPIIQREEVHDKGKVYYKLGQRPSPMKSKTKSKQAQVSDINKENSHEYFTVGFDAREKGREKTRTPFGTRLENILYPRRCVERSIQQVVAMVYDDVTKSNAIDDNIGRMNEHQKESDPHRNTVSCAIVEHDEKATEGIGSGEHVLAQPSNEPIFPAVDGSGDFLQVLKEYNIRPTHSMNSMRSLICGLENGSITIEKKSDSLLKIVDKADDILNGRDEREQSCGYGSSQYSNTSENDSVKDKCENTEIPTEQKIETCTEPKENGIVTSSPQESESVTVDSKTKYNDGVKTDNHIHWKKRLYTISNNKPAVGNVQPHPPFPIQNVSDDSTLAITAADAQEIDDTDRVLTQDIIDITEEVNQPDCTVDTDERPKRSLAALTNDEQPEELDERETPKAKAGNETDVLERSACQEITDDDEPTIKIVSCCSLANDESQFNVWDQQFPNNKVNDNDLSDSYKVANRSHLDDINQDGCSSQADSEGSECICECDWTSPMVFVDDLLGEPNTKACSDNIFANGDTSKDDRNISNPSSKSSSDATLDLNVGMDEVIEIITPPSIVNVSKTTETISSQRTDDPKVLCSKESRAKQALLFQKLSPLHKSRKKRTAETTRCTSSKAITNTFDDISDRRVGCGIEASTEHSMHGKFIADLRYTEIPDPSSGLTIRGYAFNDLDVSIPFTVKFGYKYALVRDVHQLFPQCSSRCPLVRNVVKKHKGLAATICSWDDVRNFDLIRDQMSQTGDILVRIDLLLKNGVGLYKYISSQHRQQTRMAQGCKECNF